MRRRWKSVLVGTFHGINEKNLFLIAGGVTYYVLLALFPALLALVSIYGLIFDPSQVEKQIAAMDGVLPDAARQLIGTELHQIVSASGGELGFGAVVGLIVALWTASRGMSGVMSALDIAYGEIETRGFLRFNFEALVMTLAVLVGGLLGIALVAGLPRMVESLGSETGGIIKWMALAAEWPVLIVILMSLLALLYRFAPDRHPPRWRWFTPGAAVGTLLWIASSLLFSMYVAHFNNYNATYGALGAIVVLMTWLYLSAFVVLLGAQINAEVERLGRPAIRRHLK